MLPARFRRLPAVRRKRRRGALALAAYGGCLASLALAAALVDPLLAPVTAAVAALFYVLRRGMGSGGIELWPRIFVRRTVACRADAPVVWDAARTCAERAGIPMPAVFLLYDHAPVACALPTMPPHGAVGVRASFARALPPPIIEAFVAHEIAHLALKDVEGDDRLDAADLALGIAVLCVGALGAIGVFGGLALGAGLPIGPVAAMVAAALGAAVAARLRSSWRRRMRFDGEFAADELAGELVGRERVAVSLFLLSAMGRERDDDDGDPDATHPPTAERIAALLIQE